MRLAKFKRSTITGREQILLAVPAAIPHRADGVDHVFRRKPISPGDFGITGLASVEHAAFGNKLGPGGPMNGTIHPATAQEGGIRRVDDGVNAQCGDISDDDFQPRATDLTRSLDISQGQTAASTGMPFSAKSCCNSPAWNISRTMSQPPTNSPLT